MLEKINEKLLEAYRSLQIADHLIYVTFPLLKDKRLLLKSLEELGSSLLNIISSILQYEYIYKRINLSKDSRINFETFTRKCTITYGISEEEKLKISELLSLVDKHKKSGMEFARNGKIIILSDNLKTETLTIERIKIYLELVKRIIKKAEERIKRKI